MYFVSFLKLNFEKRTVNLLIVLLSSLEVILVIVCRNIIPKRQYIIKHWYFRRKNLTHKGSFVLLDLHESFLILDFDSFILNDSFCSMGMNGKMTSLLNIEEFKLLFINSLSVKV